MKTFTFFILAALALFMGFSGCAETNEHDESISGNSGETYVGSDVESSDVESSDDTTSDIENGGEFMTVNMTVNIKVSSRAFEENTSIPKKYTCDGEDLNPSLEFEGVPAEAKSLVLIMDDPDAPGGTFTHWLIWGPPDLILGIAEGERPGKEGRNDFGKVGYGGPCPPRGAPHRYFFRLYALDTEPDLEEGASRKELEAAMAGHVLAEGELMGRYGRA